MIKSSNIHRVLSLPFRKLRAHVALMSLALAACGTVPLTPAPEDPPIFPRIDARVGVVYASAARTPVIVNPIMRIEVGKASVARFEQVFASMFTQAVELPDWPPWREGSTGLDGVIVLEQTDAELLLTDNTNPNRDHDFVRIAYRVCLYAPDGIEIRCWTVSAQQRHQRRFTESLKDCIIQEIDITMREAIARFMVEAENDPALQAWSARISRQRISP